MVTIERIKPCNFQVAFFDDLDDFLLGCPTGKYGLPVMDEVPAGLIDIVSAAHKYEGVPGVDHKNIGAWVRRGRIRQIGWLRNPKQNILVVSERELEHYMSDARHENKGGRNHRAQSFPR